MPNLTKFLLARITEDEQAAERLDLCPYAGGDPGNGAVHLSRNRALAECETKKNLVNYAAYMLKAWDDKHNNRASAWPDMTRRERHTANVILETLAQPYADHPDLDPLWRVE